MSQTHAEKLDAFEAERDQVNDDFIHFETAAAEETFSGKLRQAIHRGPLPLSVLMQRTGIEKEALVAFLRGDAPLPSDAIDRIADVLGLALQPAAAD